MEYEEFRKRIIKARGKHHFKVTNSYRNKDAWRWLKKNKWLDLGQPITEKEFGIIIKAINLTLQDQLLQGRDVIFPQRMGMIELRKFKDKIGLEGGKIKTNLPPDWKRTLNLWYEDKESLDNKTLVRYEGIERFTIYYNKGKANFENKSLYKFSPIRDIKKKLKDKIVNGEIDAFILGRRNELHQY